MNGTDRVHIWSDEHGAYWRGGGCGYTQFADEAGVWTYEDARSTTAHCGPEKRIMFRPAGIYEHPDDRAVDEFAARMKAKLRHAREAKGRGGWEDKRRCSADDLSDLLRDHVERGDPVDVANFAMMLAIRGEPISSIEDPKDTAATWILDHLAEVLKVKCYSVSDGSETWEGDVGGTVYNILCAAGVLDEDTHEIAKIANGRPIVPAKVRSAADRTRRDLGTAGTNYPDVRAMLDFVESCIGERL